MKSSIKHFLVATIGFGSCVVNAQNVLIKHKPEHPIFEKANDKKNINFDFIINNTTKDTMRLTRLEIRLLDKNNRLIQQKFLDNNGTAPSINTIPEIQWNGVSQNVIFNPFHEVHSTTHQLEYTFTFNNEIEVKETVVPIAYNQLTDFNLPLQSKLLVYDGHDFYSHHRRFNYEFTPIKQLGFNGNFMRYAYDFVVLNDEGKQFTGKGENNTDWFGFGSNVTAVADGEIIAVETHQKDDKSFDIPSLKSNPMALYGNYVVIKHGPDVYSMYGHLKQESSKKFKIGTKVKKGQNIGQIGTSGSSFFPHLHFEMRNGINHDAEGLPSYFSNYSVFLGSTQENIKKGTVNTGDIIQSK